MCIGEAIDRLASDELQELRTRASDAFPAHMFAVQVNAERLNWVVLEPPAARADLLRVTICRISPCIMVLIEDEVGRRQICSADDVDSAMTYARRAADRAATATNLHPPHVVCQ